MEHAGSCPVSLARRVGGWRREPGRTAGQRARRLAPERADVSAGRAHGCRLNRLLKSGQGGHEDVEPSNPLLLLCTGKKKHGLGVSQTGFLPAQLPKRVLGPPATRTWRDELSTQDHPHPSTKPQGLAGANMWGKWGGSMCSLPSLSLSPCLSNLQAERTKVSSRNGCSRGSAGEKIKTRRESLRTLRVARSDSWARGHVSGTREGMISSRLSLAALRQL